MSPQPIKTKVLAVSLFIGSICGTFGLFGCVPLLAQLLSSTVSSPSQQWQGSPPQVGASKAGVQPLKTNLSIYPGRIVVKERPEDSPSRRPML